MKINGKKVIDAKRSLHLEITNKDVENGKSRKQDKCAAAVACVRQLGAESARVHLSRVYVEFLDKWIRYKTPNSLRTEIVSFDRGKKFESGEYDLPPLQPSKKEGHPTRVGSKSGSKNNKTKRKSHHHITGIRASAFSNHFAVRGVSK